MQWLLLLCCFQRGAGRHRCGRDRAVTAPPRLTLLKATGVQLNAARFHGGLGSNRRRKRFDVGNVCPHQTILLFYLVDSAEPCNARNPEPMFRHP